MFYSLGRCSFCTGSGGYSHRLRHGILGALMQPVAVVAATTKQAAKAM